jgi:BolA protein
MTDTGGYMTETLREKLTAAFRPDYLEVIDESEAHRGHEGWHEGGGTHFRVVMRAASLNDLSRIDRSRAVHRALAEELRGGVHALALDLAGSG